MLPVEEWNAQISLLTGMAAADLMIYARVGLLRTLPPPDPRDVLRLHRTAKALDIEWPAEQLYPDFIRSRPVAPRRRDGARLHAAAPRVGLRRLQRRAYPGSRSTPRWPRSTPTSPRSLRRLVDRYALEVCLALCAETEVRWVLARLEPATMQESGQRASRYERTILDLVEAAVLHKHVGETFPGVVVSVEEDATRGRVVIQEPAIEAAVSAPHDLPLGTDVRVRLAEADPENRTVRFELA